MILFPAFFPQASAGIGAGSTLKVDTQTQMLFREGGGYITWEISGEVVKDLRRDIDVRLGDGNGNLSEPEASAYIGELDGYLENSYIYYGSARIVRTALLTKDINVDTEGLLRVSVNSTSRIIIRFYYNANLRTEGADVDFGDLRIPMAVFRGIQDPAGQAFAGALDWHHTEIVVGFASFSRVDTDRGQITRLRAPGAEILWYHLSVQNQTSSDRARFETFDAFQCPLELFVVLCVFGVTTLRLPAYFMKQNKMGKVRWLHWLALLLVVISMVLYFAAVDGLAIWVTSPLFMVLTGLLSYQIYGRRWKGLARPLAPEISAREAAPAGPAPPVEPPGLRPPSPPASPPTGPQAAEEAIPEAPARLLSPAPQPPGPSGKVPGGQVGPPAPLSPGNLAPLRPTAPAPGTLHPAPPGGVPRSLRCPRCKATFDIRDTGVRPLAIRCASCGTEGVLRK